MPGSSHKLGCLWEYSQSRFYFYLLILFFQIDSLENIQQIKKWFDNKMLHMLQSISRRTQKWHLDELVILVLFDGQFNTLT